jgi:pseudaminic acid cytidylyltransferase
VLRHAIDKLMPAAAADDLVCCLYATAPFVRPDDLLAGLGALKDPSVDFALGVTAFRAPIQRALRLDTRSRVSMFDPTQFPRRSQDLEAAFHDAGQFCWGRATAWLATANVFTPSCVGIVLPGHRVQDIDNVEDWQRAELMLRSLQQYGDAE